MQDLDSLVKHANNFKIARFMTDKFPHPYTTEDGKAFISFVGHGSPANILAITVEDEAVGGIGLHPQMDVYRRNMELGYWLAEPFWGKGIVSSAIREMVQYGFSHWDVTRIFARPFGSNTASQKVLMKAGFTLEAKIKEGIFKNGEFQDELIFAIRPNEVANQNNR